MTSTMTAATSTTRPMVIHEQTTPPCTLAVAASFGGFENDRTG